MSSMKLPLFYHPTTTLFVDDDELFLRSLSLNVDDDHAYALCSDVNKASDLISKYSYNNKLVDEVFNIDLLVDPALSENDVLSVDFSLASFQLNTYNRFNIISNSVIDYTMPKLNGVELGKIFKSKENLLKILMLTGTANSDIAISALNNKSIDEFIYKLSDGVLEYINDSINKFKWQYFIDYSSSCASIIKSKSATFFNGAFDGLIKKLMAEYNIVEFYTIDANGSLVLYSKTGEKYYFMVKHKDDLTGMADYAEDANVPKEIAQRIRLFQSIPVFFEENLKSNTAEKNWQLSSEIKRIPGNMEYYYYFFLSQDETDILSYETFMNDVWPSY